jgi:RNA polymerase sigma-70 factor (ECF subfamily)
VAEELVQEAFLRIYRKLDLFREESVFSTWMFTVATRLFTSHVRKHNPRWLQIDELKEMSGSDDPARTAYRRDRHELVRRAVGGLPAKFRDAIILYYFLEKDTAEVAGVLEISPGTLKSRLHRGRKMLEKTVGNLLPAEPSPTEA